MSARSDASSYRKLIAESSYQSSAPSLGVLSSTCSDAHALRHHGRSVVFAVNLAAELKFPAFRLEPCRPSDMPRTVGCTPAAIATRVSDSCLRDRKSISRKFDDNGRTSAPPARNRVLPALSTPSWAALNAVTYRWKSSGDTASDRVIARCGEAPLVKNFPWCIVAALSARTSSTAGVSHDIPRNRAAGS